MIKEKEQARHLIDDVPVFCAFDEIKNISPSECGNYKSHDLYIAKECLAHYRRVLVHRADQISERTE